MSAPSKHHVALVLQHVQDNVEQFTGDSVFQLAATLARISVETPDGELNINFNELPQADVDELWEVMQRIAAENGQEWEIREKPDDEEKES